MIIPTSLLSGMVGVQGYNTLLYNRHKILLVARYTLWEGIGTAKLLVGVAKMMSQ